MKSTQVRALWQSFWETDSTEERKHTRANAASLIVNSSDDPTTMFNTAGMQQFVPYLMGKKHSGGTQLYNIQGCVRTNDIDEVGDVSHLTYFEMMGNRSLGAYFNKESIARSRLFLTGKERLGLDPKNLAVSVFEGDNDAPRDEESAGYRQDMGVAPERIAYLGKSDNRWGPAGATGPCGPDTEIFYRIGEGEAPDVFDPEKDDENWLEIWNNVFMAYYKDDKGAFSELAQKNVDTGMGFERLCLVMQCVRGEISKPIREASVFDTDVFSGIMSYLDQQTKDIRKQRIIADHVRTAFLLIEEGLVPSNEGRGYVLRRLIRRMYFQRYRCFDHSASGDHGMTKIREFLGMVMKELNVLYDNKFTSQTVKLILEEVEQFDKTIHNGEHMLMQIIEKSPTVRGEDVFKLYDTYGFPTELTKEIAEEKGGSADMSGFQKCLSQAQEKSRAGSQKMFAKNIDRAAYIDGLPQTEFIGYDQLESEGIKLLKEFNVEGQTVCVFDKTPFYAEGGGQKSDTGLLILDNNEKKQVVNIQKYGGVFLHFVS